MTQHPNATASAFTAGAAALALYVAHRLGYAHVTSEDAVVATGVASTVVLWVGRRGLKAALTSVWRGSTKPAATASE